MKDICLIRALVGKLSIYAVGVLLWSGSVGAQGDVVNKPQKKLSLEALDQEDKKSAPKKKKRKKSTSAKKENTKIKEEAPKKKSPLPTIDELMDAKLGALLQKQKEQGEALKEAELKLLREQEIQDQIFDTSAYLSLGILNTAPPDLYRLERTEVYLDRSRTPMAIGGKHNQGLPRKSEIFFGAINPGCHEVRVRAWYTRIKNNLISRLFGIKRKIKIDTSQSFIAQNGFRVDLEIEGFEKPNSLARFKRTPMIRFNTSVRKNFLLGASLVSMDSILKQGRVRIDYMTEDQSHHKLLEKSISIDGLPILTNAKHDFESGKNIVFDSSLGPGKHTANVTLLFAERKRVGGGPMYNFRLSFNRDFWVVPGQQTILNLVGMPHGGIRKNSQESRYARATSKVMARRDSGFFPEMTCKAWLKFKQEQELKESLKLPKGSEAGIPKAGESDAAQEIPQDISKTKSPESPIDSQTGAPESGELEEPAQPTGDNKNKINSEESSQDITKTKSPESPIDSQTGAPESGELEEPAQPTGDNKNKINSDTEAGQEIPQDITKTKSPQPSLETQEE